MIISKATELRTTAVLRAALLLLAISTVASFSATAAPRTPPWHSLEYQANYMWVTAESRLEVTSQSTAAGASGWLSPDKTRPLKPYGPRIWHLQVENRVDSNTEVIDSWLDPQNLRAYQRERLSKGRNQRLKTYRFLQKGVWRERREAGAGDAGNTVSQWPVSSEGWKRHPESMPDNARVTTAYGLFMLASSADLASTGDTLQRFVFTDLDFLLVQLEVTGTEPVATNYELNGQPVQSQVDALIISVSAAPVAGTTQEDPFTLLGLGGPIEILLDPGNRLPLAVRGTAPRLGEASLQLGRASTQAAGEG